MLPNEWVEGDDKDNLSYDALLRSLDTLECGNVDIRVIPVMGSLLSASDRACLEEKGVTLVDVEVLFTQEELTLLTKHIVNIMGTVSSGKSTIQSVITSLWPDTRLLPEAKVASSRPLREGEVNGVDVVLYETDADFEAAMENGEMILAYRFRRSEEEPDQLCYRLQAPTEQWQWAGLCLSQLRRVLNEPECRYLTIINGFAWMLFREAFPLIRSFCVVTTSDDYLAFCRRAGRSLSDGQGLNDYGFAVPNSRIPGVTWLPNALIPLEEEDVRDVLEVRFRDPLVREYVRQTLFWSDSLDLNYVDEREPVDLNHVWAVLFGLTDTCKHYYELVA